MKSAFITGANRGLGYGFAKYLASKGFLVFVGKSLTGSLSRFGCVFKIKNRREKSRDGRFE